MRPPRLWYFATEAQVNHLLRLESFLSEAQDIMTKLKSALEARNAQMHVEEHVIGVIERVCHTPWELPELLAPVQILTVGLRSETAFLPNPMATGLSITRGGHGC